MRPISTLDVLSAGGLVIASKDETASASAFLERAILLTAPMESAAECRIEVDGRTVWASVRQEEEGRRFSFRVVSPAATGPDQEDFTFSLDDGSGADVFVGRPLSGGTSYLIYGGVRAEAYRHFRDNTRALQINVSIGDGERALLAALIACFESPQLLEEIAAFALELARVRALPTGDDRADSSERGGSVQFVIMSPEEQLEALWQILIGRGCLALDDAVRHAAAALRDMGIADYQRLRKGGELYDCIEELLHEAAGENEHFDRPKRGSVRAVLRDATAFDLETWRECLLAVLTHEPVERETAIRAAAAYAVEVFGLEHERLRSGGNVERGLRGAINGSIRRGMVEALGATEIRLARNAGAARARLSKGEERSLDVADGDSETSQEPQDPPRQAPIPSDVDPLAVPLAAFLLPARILNWAGRAGILNVQDLIRWDPEKLSGEPNIGRGTLRKTRTILERHLGRAWEEARRDLVGTDSPGDETDTSGPATSISWDRFLEELPREYWGLDLEEVELPGRMRSFVIREGIPTAEALFSRPRANLVEQPNLGRGSLAATIEAVRAHVDELRNPAVPTSFLAMWRAELGRLEPMRRFVLSRRAGVGAAPPETLEDLGHMLGVTRERARQVEMEAVDSLRFRRRWLVTVEENLRRVLGGRSTIDLAELSRDGWWAGIDAQIQVVEYTLRRLMDSRYSIVEFGQNRLISTATQEHFDRSWSELMNRAQALAYPVRADAIMSIIDQVAPFGASAATAFLGRLDEYLHYGDPLRQTVTSFGRNKRAEVLAVLREASAPIPVKDLHARVGRCVLPDEVLFFRRGVVGLKQHFPDFDAWQARLVPACVELMRTGGPARQWSVVELREALDQSVPPWLDHWQLASLLRSSPDVVYLGRLRVALPGAHAASGRILFVEHIVEVLEDARTSLSLEEISERARKRTDVPEGTLRLALLRSPFVKLDRNLYGLLERDVPGGAVAIAQAVDTVVELLESSGRALTLQEVNSAIQEVSEVHRGWGAELVRSILRNEPEIRITRAGTIALVRAHDEVDEEAHAAPETSAEHADAAAAITPEADAVLLSRIPDEARPLFRELLQEPPRPTSVLLEEVAAHVHRFETAAREGEQVDLKLAQTLARQSRTLLDTMGLAAEQQRMIRAAVRYFVISEDGENDLQPGGLDDDAAVMVAVIRHVGLEQRVPLTEPPVTRHDASHEQPLANGRRYADLLDALSADTRMQLDGLLHESPVTFRDLSTDIEKYLATIRNHTRVNEFIDLHLAERVAEACLELLASEPADPDARAVIQAAARYFLVRSDADHDLDSLFGFEDDAVVINAALKYLGREASSVVP